MNSLKTGGDVDSVCTKCQLELAHIIVAMVHGRVARVQCKTCRTVHAYKSAAKTTKSTKAPREHAVRKHATSRSLYDDLIKGRDISRAEKYKPSTVYEEGDVIDHPTFGVGLVTRALSDGKVEVLFQVESKVLVHART